jgi:hypothetical protein
MQIRAFCTIGDIHDNNLQGGGAQFKDSIKYYMQSIYFDLFSKLKRKQGMNIVVTAISHHITK